ncbi:TspO/MBR family protein [Cohnella rhizosphaerae]|uniref:Tryptophan-rich sensory protein n=1 Tax=Cohnella rhizosphaerae TaxID=1457232 RepID=A0A9X4KXI4_9BACL|nr:TspO/MBR family protein [Cohnella rhizosphaerae]MDG0812191.1 tryptophan-rich sensory protein [Cohnella rhizosphaerae]
MPLHWRILNAAGWLGVVAVNAAAATGGLLGKSSGEISDQVPTLVTPAGYAFSIWSVIYLLTLGYVVAAFLPSRRGDKTMGATAPWFFASCLFNVGWLFVWHSERYTASAFVIVGLLLTLVGAYLSSRPAARVAHDRAGFFLIALPLLRLSRLGDGRDDRQYLGRAAGGRLGRLGRARPDLGRGAVRRRRAARGAGRSQGQRSLVPADDRLGAHRDRREAAIRLAIGRRRRLDGSRHRDRSRAVQAARRRGP